uniref:Uncharacterized protein n=1 Tax=Oryza meridionalis TaxID=40149 RepID=A0A0E0DV98_9ORYZ
MIGLLRRQLLDPYKPPIQCEVMLLLLLEDWTPIYSAGSVATVRRSIPVGVLARPIPQVPAHLLYPFLLSFGSLSVNDLGISRPSSSKYKRDFLFKLALLLLGRHHMINKS